MPSLPLTDQLLLLVASLLDHRRWLTQPSLAGALAGDPRLYRNRRLVHRYLRSKRERQKIQKAIYELKRRHYLEEQVLGGSRGYVFTPKGALRLFRINISQHSKMQRLPHGKWLMVFFDVPEILRRKRDWLRVELKTLGFAQLQRSVWATPYRVQRELQELIRLLGLQEYAKPLIVEEFPK